MSDKMTNKDIEQKYKDCLKNIKLHFKLLNCLHELALANRDFERAEFESKVEEFVGDRDFYYIKDFMECKKAS